MIGAVLPIQAASDGDIKRGISTNNVSPQSDISTVSSIKAENNFACQTKELLVLNTDDPQQLSKILRQIEGQGGCAVHIFPPSYLLGDFPSTLLTTLTQNGILKKSYSTNSALTMEDQSDLPDWMAVIWQQTISNRFAASASLTVETTGSPLIGDVRIIPETKSYPGLLATQSITPDYYQTSEFMAGKIAVGIIFPESNGSLDTSSENWSSSRMDTVIAKIQSAMNWWAIQNPNGHLSFVYDVQRQVPTKYEPIRHSSSQDDLWINDVFAKLGYSNLSMRTNTFDYLNALRNKYHTDWAVVAFVVDSYNDADGEFTDGYFAYTYVNPGLIVMTYDNDGWGINNLDSVMAHEFAHDFGAADEYCQPGYACCWGGYDYDGYGYNYSYLYIPNSNCEAGCDQNRNGICDGNDSTPNSNCQNCSLCVQVSCLMRNGGLYAGVDTPTKQQVGIRDSDGDGILDPMDTSVSLVISQSPPSTTQERIVQFSGVASETPYPTANPAKKSVTINYISDIQVQLDNSNLWTSALADDGAYDEVQESFTYTTPSLGYGDHTVKIRAVDRSGNISSIYQTRFTVLGDPALFINYQYLPLILTSPSLIISFLISGMGK